MKRETIAGKSKDIRIVGVLMNYDVSAHIHPSTYMSNAILRLQWPPNMQWLKALCFSSLASPSIIVFMLILY